MYACCCHLFISEVKILKKILWLIVVPEKLHVLLDEPENVTEEVTKPKARGARKKLATPRAELVDWLGFYFWSPDWR